MMLVGAQYVVEQRWGRWLYVLTAVNPCLAVLTNDYYTRIELPIGIQPPIRSAPAAATLYRTIFYFARSEAPKGQTSNTGAAT